MQKDKGPIIGQIILKNKNKVEGTLYLSVRLTMLLQQDSMVRHTDQGYRRSFKRETSRTLSGR